MLNVDIKKTWWQENFFRRSDSKEGEECTFQQKIQHAMLANFSAAIVFNYKDDILIPMGGSHEEKGMI